MDSNNNISHQGTSLIRILVLFLFAGVIVLVSSVGTYYYVSNQMQTKQNEVITAPQPIPTIQQETTITQQILPISPISKGWKIFESETAYGAGSKFSIQYPPDWSEFSLGGGVALEYKKWLGVPVNSDSCLVTLGSGGTGYEGGDVAVETSSKNYGDLSARKMIFRQGEKIIEEVTTFSRNNIEYIFELFIRDNADHDKCKQDYENILSTFRFL